MGDISTITVAVGHGSILGGIISFSVGALVNGLLNGITSWIESGTAMLLAAFGHALESTTSSPLGNGFGTEFSVVWRIGAVLTLPFLLLATIHAVVRQDLSLITRAVFVRLPFAVLFGVVAVAIVTQALVVTDQLSSTLLATAGHPARVEIDQLVGAFTPGFGGLALSGFTGVLLALLAAAVAFILWVELIVRSAAVAVATLFIPIALAGLVWSATAHWARRVGETLAALVLSKLVIAGVARVGGAVDRGGLRARRRYPGHRAAGSRGVVAVHAAAPDPGRRVGCRVPSRRSRTARNSRRSRRRDLRRRIGRHLRR